MVSRLVFGNSLKLGCNILSSESTNISKRTSRKTGVKAYKGRHCSSSSQVFKANISHSSKREQLNSTPASLTMPLASSLASHCLPNSKRSCFTTLYSLYSQTTQAICSSPGCLEASPVHCQLTLLAAGGLRQHTPFKDTSPLSGGCCGTLAHL